ncbi:MAG TPA: ABC transporter permease [Candidatus Dormibacteraeota bacterium]
MIGGNLRPGTLPSLRRAGSLVERNAILYRRSWLIIVSGFAEPLFYLLGIGLGVGALIGSTVTLNGHSVRYAVFVAPALMASAAMNGAVYETSFNFFFKLRYVKLYDAILSTPLGVLDVAAGEIAWALVRGTLYAIGFIAVMFGLGLAPSPWTIVALPAAMLMSFAFGAAGAALTTFLRTWQDIELILIVLIPLFLFSATFYPLEVYPGFLRLVVELTPLYHGVNLLRSLTTGSLGQAMLVDIGYLLALGVLGLWIATLRLDRVLLK